MKKNPNPQFDVYESAMNDWRWRLVARNGEVIAAGEGHGSRKDANRAVAAVKRAVRQIDERDDAKRGVAFVPVVKGGR